MIKEKKGVVTILILLCLLAGLSCACHLSTSDDDPNAEPYRIDAEKAPNDARRNQFDLTDLDQAVTFAIFSTNEDTDADYRGECFAEGHSILDVIENGKETAVCVQVVEGYFGFENGIFTSTSGSSVPSLLRFIKNDEEEFLLKSYEIPKDGTGYHASLKKMFSAKAIRKLNTLQIDELYPQLEAYGKAYLNSIGREATVQWDRIETVLPNMDSTSVSNALLAQYGEYPMWIGTLEKIEGGTRMVYTHLWEGDGKGGGTATYRKEVYGGEIVAESIIQVEGDQYGLIKDSSVELS